jgi:hypothetical protein
VVWLAEAIRLPVAYESFFVTFSALKLFDDVVKVIIKIVAAIMTNALFISLRCSIFI